MGTEFDYERELRRIDNDNEFELWMLGNKDEMTRIFMEMFHDEFIEFCKEKFEEDKE